MPDVEDSPIVPKKEHSREHSLSSISSPGAEHDVEFDGQASPPANVQVQKRKGGRKPIYATSEERKQRNRQAQAAFRERRTEYIKQLETTIKHQDETLQTLQQNHRSAADECLMLRYKNSLLERILLEKGIDVQAELKKKEITIPSKVPASLPQPTPIQRAAMNRHQQLNRSNSGPASNLPKLGTNTVPNQSPQLQPSHRQHAGSPDASRSSSYGLQNSMNPPSSGFKPPLHSIRAGPPPNLSSPSSSTNLQPIAPSPTGQPGSASLQRPSHWPSPYQTHIEQLEQEYDASDVMEEHDGDEPSGSEHYSRQYSPNQRPHQHLPGFSPGSQPQPTMQGQQGAIPPGGDPNAGSFNQMGGQMFDPFDPMLDADPFGLSATMHFPTQFSFQESSMRK